jgi:hypothetical protein
VSSTGSPIAVPCALCGTVKREDRVLASEVEIGDHVTTHGEEWEVTNVTDRRGGEEIHLELTRWTAGNQEVTEWFVFDADDEIEE